MPRFNITEQQSIANPNRAASESFGGGTGLQQVGQAASELGNQMVAYKLKKDKDWAAVRMAKARAWGNQAVSDEYINSPEGAESLSDVVDQKFQEERKRILDEAPSSVRGQIGDQLEILRLQLLDRAGSLSIQASADKAVDDYNSIVNSSANALLNDPESLDFTIDEVSDFLENQRLDAGAKRDLLTGAKDKLAKAAIRSMDPEDALEDLREGRFDDYLDPDTKASLIGAKGRELKGILAEEKKAVEAEKAKKLSDLQIRVGRGEASYQEVEDNYANGDGWLEPKDRSRLILELDRVLKKKTEKANQVADVNLRLKLGDTFDPKDTDDRKAINAHYEALAAYWADLPPQEFMQRSIDYSIRTGIIPDPVQSQVRGNIRAGTDEQRVLAASMLQRLRKGNSELMNEFDNEDISLGNLISAISDYGVQPSDAVRLSLESRQVPEAVRTERETLYREAEKENPAVSWIADNIDELYDGKLGIDEVPLSMAEQFNNLAELEYVRHGNIDAARRSALDRTLRVWGESGINGVDQMMEFAPEKFYGVQGLSLGENTKWMREQLIDAINEDSFGADIPEEDISITVNRFETTKAGLPVYDVRVQGIPSRRKDGTLKPFAFDWKSSKEYKRREKQRAEQVAKDARLRGIRMGEIEATPEDLHQQQVDRVNVLTEDFDAIP